MRSDLTFTGKMTKTHASLLLVPGLQAAYQSHEELVTHILSNGQLPLKLFLARCVNFLLQLFPWS